MLSIIVLNYNRLHYTKQTVQHLIDRTTVDHEFIFVDNGSVDGTREYLKDLENSTNAKKVTCVFNPSNYGVAGGRNSGLRIATGDYLMTIDDDIIVPDKYDKKLIEVCDNIPNIGITGICVERKSHRLPIVKRNGVLVRLKKKGNLGGGCMCVSKKVFDKIGYFSTDFVYGIEDVDICMRTERLGLDNLYISELGEHIDTNDNKEYFSLKKKVHNKKSKQFKQIGNNWQKYKNMFKINKSVYVPYMEPNIVTDKFDKVILKNEK